MADDAVIRRLLDSLRESLEHLQSKQAVALAGYKQDRDLRAIVERRLETAIQACIDMGNHIIAREHFGSPADYGRIFSILAERGIVNPDLGGKLMKMAGFRNVLIHEYRDILDEKVHDILQNHLSDFREFALAMLNYLDQAGASSGH